MSDAIPPQGPPPGQWPQQQWPPQPPPPSKPRGRWIVIGAVAVLVVAVVAGLGIWWLTSGKSTDEENAKPDLSKLDVGRYPTEPRALPGPTTEEEGRYLAAFRLAEGMANPYEIDSKLEYLYGIAMPDPAQAAASISGTSTPIVQPVLEKYGMVTGYMVQSYSQRIEEFVKDPKGDALLVLLTSFPNDDAAARAAVEMDSADAAINPDNQPLSIPGYPQAKAHYRPGYTSLGATMAQGRLVVSIVTSSTSGPQIGDLTGRVQRLLDKQLPLMADLIPVVETSLTSLPLDPDNMLSRAFVAGEQPKISAEYGSMGPRAVVLCANNRAVKDGLFQQSGVDRCAFSTEGILLRVEAEKTAGELLPKLVEADAQYIDHDVAPPNGIEDARCNEQKKEVWADNEKVRFQCLVAFERYVAVVFSNEEQDARQRAAAQYAILVNSD